MAINGGNARRQLMQAICAVACAALEAEAASVAVVDRHAGEFVFIAASGQAQDLVGGRFRTSKGVAGRVMAGGETLIVDATRNDPEFAHEVAVATGFEPDSLAVAPIHLDGPVVGVLSVLDAAPQCPEETLRLLHALAGHAAAGLGLAVELESAGLRA